MRSIRSINTRFLSSRAPALCFAVLAGILLFYALYSWTLSLFLVRVPLVDLDRTIDADELAVFQLPDVGHFEGILLDGDERQLSYRLPSLVDADRLDSLEVFAAPGPGNEEGLQPIHIEQDGQRHTIEGQRTRIPWQSQEGEVNTLTLSSPAATPQDPLLVSIRTHGGSPWGPSIALTIASLLSLFLALRLGLALPSRRTLMPVFVLAIVMAVFWSAGLISLDYFGLGHGRLSGMAIRFGEALQDGHFNRTQYRPTTFALPVLLALPLEGFAATTREIVHIYPVTRFALTIVTFAAFAFLTLSWSARAGRDSGIVLAILLGTFYPFIHDTFFPDVDALLIPVCAAITALVLRWGAGQSRPSMTSILFGLTLLVVAFSLKTTALAFVPMLGAFAFARSRNVSTTRRALVAGGVVAALLLVYYPSSSLGEIFQHPDRNVGVDDLRFQETQLWHVVWGGYGHFDRDTAFSFTSVGRERNDIVAEELGVPSEGYLRQSQAATEEVYKPGVLNALDEMPSFFVSTAWHRLQTHGLRLYRYTAGAGGLIRPWTENTEARVDHLDGEPASQPDMIQQSTRLGRYWRIAPTVLLSRLQQGALSQAWDVALLGAGLLGLALLPVPGVRAYLAVGALLQIAMISGVHVMYRYGAFLSIIILLGLAWLVTRAFRLLHEP